MYLQHVESMDMVDMYVPAEDMITLEHVPVQDSVEAVCPISQMSVMVQERSRPVSMSSSVYDLARLLAWLFRSDITYNLSRMDLEIDEDSLSSQEDC